MHGFNIAIGGAVGIALSEKVHGTKLQQ